MSIKIALISDVHANLPALSAVLADIRRRKIRIVWNLGDSVGYGPFPRETLALLMRSGSRSIRGNYDDKVLQFPRKKGIWKRTKSPLKFFCLRWAHEHISARQRAFLERLPHSFTQSLSGKKICAVHGSPESSEEALGPGTGVKRFKVLASVTSADIICCGHSHAYFARPIRKKWFINPGSVGRPFDGDPRASYAIVTLGRGVVSVRNIRVPYDIEKLRARAVREHFNRVLLSALTTARSLDDCRVEMALSSGAVTAFAEKYRYEASHAGQVTRCALQLFDALAARHGLGAGERAYLNAAALLHDIGFSSARAHHKKTFTLIRRHGNSLGLSFGERNLIGCIARYHRKALPHPAHSGYAHLSGKDRMLVSVLAAILRVADGLDSSHTQSSHIKHCLVRGSQVTIVLKRNAYLCDKAAAVRKSDLFRRVFRKKLVIR